MAKPPDPLPPEVLDAFRRRQPIQAIALLLRSRIAAQAAPTRPAASRPAAAAKPVAPGPAAARHAPAPPAARRGGLSPGELPRARASVWAWVVVALVAYLGYRLLGR